MLFDLYRKQSLFRKKFALSLQTYYSDNASLKITRDPADPNLTRDP